MLTLTACLPGGIIEQSHAITPTPESEFAGTDSFAAPPQPVVINFLEAWKNDDYEKMYGCLTPLSQDSIGKEEFSTIYNETAVDLTLQRLDYELLSTLIQGNEAQTAIRVFYHTILADELEREIMVNLSLVQHEWKIRWEHGLILPELSGGNHLAVDTIAPSRGNIYDNQGNAIVVHSRAYAIGINPSQIDPASGKELWEYLSILTGKSVEYIEKQYREHSTEEYIPLGNISEQEYALLESPTMQFNGMVMQPYESRYYLEHGIAPQTIGYVMPIPAEDVEYYRRSGYNSNDRIGMSGLEKWSENDLMGQRAADIYVVDADGEIVTRLSHRASEPAKSIYTTLDSNLQIKAQKAIQGFRGAIVVMQRDNGKILAMVSSPHFDPNNFNVENINSQTFLYELMNDKDQSLLNRATQGVYPLGSVFKLITLGAALESGLYSENSKYNCTYEYKEIPGLILYDWTYKKGVEASGELTLPEGLIRSCNPWFWHIGLDLYFNYDTKALADMARAYGLSKATGIKQVSEASGSIENPDDEGDAIQMAIGQGTVLVTPLQVAVFTAALGNEGTLYQPQIIEKIVSPDGHTSFSFQPEISGHLPLKINNLNLIQEAMQGVITNEHGSAYSRFLGINLPIHGKTGTAQNPHGDAHAWFAGYTDAGLADKPDIAVVVVAENAGEGSDIAAPISRRIIEIYFFGQPSTLYPWEKSLYEPFTPTPAVTSTNPQKESTKTPKP